MSKRRRLKHSPPIDLCIRNNTGYDLLLNEINMELGDLLDIPPQVLPKDSEISLKVSSISTVSTKGDNHIDYIMHIPSQGNHCSQTVKLSFHYNPHKHYSQMCLVDSSPDNIICFHVNKNYFSKHSGKITYTISLPVGPHIKNKES